MSRYYQTQPDSPWGFGVPKLGLQETDPGRDCISRAEGAETAPQSLLHPHSGPPGECPAGLFTSASGWSSHFPQPHQPHCLLRTTELSSHPEHADLPTHHSQPSAFPVSNPVKGKPQIYCYCLPTQLPPRLDHWPHSKPGVPCAFRAGQPRG